MSTLRSMTVAMTMSMTTPAEKTVSSMALGAWVTTTWDKGVEGHEHLIGVDRGSPWRRLAERGLEELNRRRDGSTGTNIVENSSQRPDKVRS